MSRNSLYSMGKGLKGDVLVATGYFLWESVLHGFIYLMLEVLFESTCVGGTVGLQNQVQSGIHPDTTATTELNLFVNNMIVTTFWWWKTQKTCVNILRWRSSYFLCCTAISHVEAKKWKKDTKTAQAVSKKILLSPTLEHGRWIPALQTKTRQSQTTWFARHTRHYFLWNILMYWKE